MQEKDCGHWIILYFCALKKNGDVAQLVEHLVPNQGVAGSNPVFSTKSAKV